MVTSWVYPSPSPNALRTPFFQGNWNRRGNRGSEFLKVNSLSCGWYLKQQTEYPCGKESLNGLVSINMIRGRNCGGLLLGMQVFAQLSAVNRTPKILTYLFHSFLPKQERVTIYDSHMMNVSWALAWYKQIQSWSIRLTTCTTLR